MNLEDSERNKYERVWKVEQYRSQSDGLPVVGYAHHVMRCQPGESLIDWGCGAGHAAAVFRDQFGLEVTGFDIAANCLNPDIDIPLVVGSIWNPPENLVSDYAFSTDVLEHIPPEWIETALDVIAARTRVAAYIQVDTVVDISGDRMSPPERLHMTIQPEAWWRESLLKRWQVVKPCAGSYTRAGFLCRWPRVEMT